MSDTKISQSSEILAKEYAKVADHNKKDKELKYHKIDMEYKRLQEQREEMERLSKMDISKVSEDYFDKMDQEQDRMIQSLHGRMPFLTEEMTEWVPFSYPNLLLIGARTGDGKSTTAANIVHSLMNDKNPQTGLRRKVLVISNEEMAVNVMNRVICLHEGWNLNDMPNFSPDRLDLLKKRRRELGGADRLRVIDGDFPEFKDATTSYEGIKFILENAEARYKAGEQPYDAIIIDYFQKISTSKERPSARPYDVLKMTTEFLDSFYKKYPAPIVVFSQIKPGQTTESGEEESFENRIKECKNLFVTCTYALEVKTKKRLSASEFICHKHRFSSQELGLGLTLGWNKGKFVSYTEEFQAEVIRRRSDMNDRELMAKAGVGAKRD